MRVKDNRTGSIFSPLDSSLSTSGTLPFCGGVCKYMEGLQQYTCLERLCWFLSRAVNISPPPIRDIRTLNTALGRIRNPLTCFDLPTTVASNCLSFGSCHEPVAAAKKQLAGSTGALGSRVSESPTSDDISVDASRVMRD
jgi:hypothetical protein